MEITPKSEINNQEEEEDSKIIFKTLSNVLTSTALGKIPLILTALATKTFKNGFIYQPPASNNKQKLSPKFKQLTIRTTDNHRITGYFLKNPKDEKSTFPLVIRFQENAGGFTDRELSYVKFSEEMNCHFLSISYRGYDSSKGYPNKKGIELDAIATLDYTFNSIIGKLLKEDTRVFVHGRSIGASVAAFVASRGEFRDRISGVILDIPLSDMVELGVEFMPCLEAVKEDVFHGEDWSILRYLEDIKCPLFVSGVVNDEICSFGHYEKIIKKAKELKLELTELVFVVGGHNDCLDYEENWVKYKECVNKLLV